MSRVHVSFCGHPLGAPPCSAAPELRVDETATRLRWLEDRTEVSLAVQHEADREMTAEIALELIDEVGAIRSRGSRSVTFRPGANVSTLSTEPALSTLAPADQEGRSTTRSPTWRLRYRISSEADAPPNEGIIAVSETAKGFYELRIAHPKRASSCHRSGSWFGKRIALRRIALRMIEK